MSKALKVFFYLLAVATVFAVINCPFLFPKAFAAIISHNLISEDVARGAANCIFLAFLAAQMLENFSRKKKNKKKAYAEPAVYLLPILLFTALFTGILIGRPLVNLVCWSITFAIGLNAFFRKK